jgi:8-oxo-dGTP pyrophosphatase MutT (NUDIX family)
MSNTRLGIGREGLSSEAPDVGFCSLKPDYVDIAPEFVADLQENGLAVIQQGPLIFPRRIIDYMYSDSGGEFFYETMADALGRRAVHAMVVVQNEPEAERLTTQGVIESLKRGSNGYKDLRAKHHRPEHRVSDGEFELWRETRPPDPNMTFRITQQNVFHAADDLRNAIGTLGRILDSSDPDTSSFFDIPQDERVIPVVRFLDRAIEANYRKDTMNEVKRKWHVITEPPITSKELPIRQVYVWLLTSDDQLVIVSKDGQHWQLPGGKPSHPEGVFETANREVLEETGLDISGDTPTFFGEYTIDDPSPETLPRYRQVRAYMRLRSEAATLALTTGKESLSQDDGDVVHHVRTVPLSEVGRYIKWLPYSEEYKALKRNKIIDGAA